MFLFAKRGISKWRSRYEPKKQLIGGLIKFAGNFHVYQAPKSIYFIGARAIGAHKSLFNV